ncbi:MAG: indole-3-glycerol phosphate synthase TrpC [Rikenellaceae bacterium]
MKDVLLEIIANTKIEVAQRKQLLPLEQLEQQCSEPRTKISMRASLEKSSSGIISEFKRRSPSKGWIKQEGVAKDITKQYEKAGASALSILTDEKFFGGTMQDIISSREGLALPIIRKDFIIDEYQIYEARKIGANAILLIAAALSVEQCESLAKKAHELELEVLLEVHSKSELTHVNKYVDMVGVNNRNLGSFHTDIQNSFELIDHLPQDVLLVSESGISKPETVKQLRQAGFKGFLIGENFMKSTQPGKELENFINEVIC